MKGFSVSKEKLFVYHFVKTVLSVAYMWLHLWLTPLKII